MFQSMKPRLEKNNINIYSTYKEGKSVVPERFILLEPWKLNLQIHDFNTTKRVHW